MDENSESFEKFEDINIIQHDKVLGRGNFGEVKQGLVNGQRVAVKIIYNRGKQVTTEAKMELNIMKQLNHKNIVRFFGIIDIDFENEPKLVFEYVENGSLSKYVASESRDERILVRLCYDIACGMEYLHSKQFIHRDLAARNILVDSKVRAKVADFGLSRFMDIESSPDNYYYMIDGDKPLPLRWAPIETIQAIVSLGSIEGKFSFSSDVWSFGVTMWEIWTQGSIPYSINGKKIDSTKVVEYINEGENPNSFDKPENAPETILDIMDEIFQVERRVRPTFYQLKEKFEHLFDAVIFEDSYVDSTDSMEGEPTSMQRVGQFSSYLETSWWPAKKMLIQALQERKIGDSLLIEKLHEVLMSNRRQMTVIMQSEASSQFSGLGGVGKTLTAKWYANFFESMYKRIIWIDSGEVSLLKSFKCLARDLGIKNRHELHDLARGCFDKLSKFKCLWIFDNVESYMGNDGIHTALPNNYQNFHCLITTRSREHWGNDTGYGAISKFEISLFDENESTEFLKKYLEPQIVFTEYQLKQLSELLGNLPLALQLAVAALNNRKMDLQDYIDQISTTFDFNIIEEKFDDYEKTINKNVLLSLEQIENEVKGKLAYKVFMIFGYIRPDDIQFEFLRAVSGLSIEDLDATLELLQKYSLITKCGREKYTSSEGMLYKLFGKEDVEIERDIFSIHRLLQQVIRHLGKPTENETIRRILNSNAFLDYMLIPYLLANDALKSSFKKLRAKLIDQDYLQKLLSDKRLQEALDLAKFIHQEVNSDASFYNYATCLKMKGEEEEAMKLYRELYSKIKLESREGQTFQGGIISLNSNPSQSYLEYLFLCESLRSKEMDLEINENESLHSGSRHVSINASFGDLNEIMHSLESCFVQSYSLQCYGNKIALSFSGTAEIIKKDKVTTTIHSRPYKKILFTRCSIDKSILLPKDIKSLTLSNVKFENQEKEEKSPSIIENVNLTSFDECFTENGFLELETLDLEHCNVFLPLSPTRISPKIIHLGEIQISKLGIDIGNINVNEIIDFCRIQKLILCSSSNHTNFSIDLSEDVTANEVQLLEHVDVIDWKTAQWKIQKLTIRDTPFTEKNKMQIVELDTNAQIDISCLSEYIEKIKILRSSIDQAEDAVTNCSGLDINLPKLTTLHISDTSYTSSCLKHFVMCENLVKLKLDFFSDVKIMWVNIQTSAIPKSVLEIEINSDLKERHFHVIGKEPRSLDILTFGNIRLKYISETLETLRPNQLVIHCNDTENAVDALMYSLSVQSIIIPTILISTNHQVYYFKNNKRQVVSNKEFGLMFLKYFSK